MNFSDSKVRKNKEKAGKFITSRLKYCGDPYGTFTISFPVTIMPPLFLISENSKNSFLGVDIFRSLWYIQFAIENNTAKTSPHEMRTSLSFLLSWQIQHIIVVTALSIIFLSVG